MRDHALLRACAISAIACLAAAACAELNRQDLCIRSLQGDVHRFYVELSSTPDERAAGLMERTELGADEGMLFDFGEAQEISMWMKNTPLALDMLFIGTSGRILRIERDTTPYSLRSIPSGKPALGVLEVLAGTTRRLDIRMGDHVLHPVFGNSCDS